MKNILILGLGWFCEKYFMFIFDFKRNHISKIIFKNLLDDSINEIHFFLKKNNISLNDISYISISCNLKSFTSMRIYYAIACSFSQFSNIKIINLNILDIMSRYALDNFILNINALPLIFLDKKSNNVYFKKKKLYKSGLIDSLKSNYIVFETEKERITNGKVFIINDIDLYVKAFIKETEKKINSNEIYDFNQIVKNISYIKEIF